MRSYCILVTFVALLLSLVEKSSSWSLNWKRVVASSCGIAFQLLSPMAFAAPGEPLYSDEVLVSVPKGSTSSLGIGLKNENYRGSIRTVVTASPIPTIKPGMILSSVAGKNVEGYSVKTVAGILKEEMGDKKEGNKIELSLRDPSLLNEALDSRRSDAPSTVTSLILPGHAADYRDQVLKVERLEKGKKSEVVADIGDVLEVSFQLRIKDNGEVIDGVDTVAAAASPYGGSKNMFFVVGSGKPPENPVLGKDNNKDDILPPGWDLFTRGMLVDELRRITIPPVIGISAVGYHPTKSLASAMSTGTVVEGELRRGTLVAKREEVDKTKKTLVSTLKEYSNSDLELEIRLLTVNGER